MVPFMAPFSPLVPDASSGRVGVFSQRQPPVTTSLPGYIIILDKKDLPDKFRLFEISTIYLIRSCLLYRPGEPFRQREIELGVPDYSHLERRSGSEQQMSPFIGSKTPGKSYS
jgi:hypothetical protein